MAAQPGNTITYTDGDGTVMLSYDGQFAQKNLYRGLRNNYEILVSFQNQRWEILGSVVNDPIASTLYFSDADTSPNPPNLLTGNWQNAVGMQLIEFSGTGTQNATAVTFDPLPILCESDSPATNLSGGSPQGGMYSGVGVTDNGDGITFTFDPSITGPGTYTVTYEVGNESVQADIDVLALPSLTFATLPIIDLSDYPPGTDVVGLGNVTPPGGTFSSTITNLVVNESETSTFALNRGLLEVGDIDIDYSYTDNDGCNAVVTQTLTVTRSLQAGDLCSNAIDISQLVIDTGSEALTTTVYDNSSLSNDFDPGSGYGCFADGHSTPLHQTLWLTFVGTGHEYTFSTINCEAATNYNPAMQAAIYEGTCGGLTPVACANDVDVSVGGITLQTVAGVRYFTMLDVESDTEQATGDFCVQISRTSNPSSTLEEAYLQVVLSPNPARDHLTLDGLPSDVRVQVYDVASGKVVAAEAETKDGIVDISGIRSGVYLIRGMIGEQVFVKKFVKL